MTLRPLLSFWLPLRVLSRPTGILMEVPKPTWLPMLVPTPSPTDMPGVPTVQALNSKTKAQEGRKGFMKAPS